MSSNLSYLFGGISLATSIISSRTCGGVIASTLAWSPRIRAFRRCSAAASISAGGCTIDAIGCGPITLPRSPRSGIAVLRAGLRNRRRKVGNVAPRRPLAGRILDADDRPLAVSLFAPSVEHPTHRIAISKSKLRDVLEADLRER